MNWPANLTICLVPNHLMIIWILLAPHLPRCIIMPFCPFPEGMGRPPQRGVQCPRFSTALVLVAILWHTFSPCKCVSVCKNASWRRATYTRRDAPYRDMPMQWRMATQEEMVTQDETAEWILNSKWPSQRRRSPYIKKKGPSKRKTTKCWTCDVGASITRGQGLNSKFSTVVRLGGVLGPWSRRFSPLVFLFLTEDVT